MEHVLQLFLLSILNRKTTITQGFPVENNHEFRWSILKIKQQQMEMFAEIRTLGIFQSDNP